MDNKKITFLIDYLINFYTFEPLLKNMIKRNQSFYIACFPEHLDFIKLKLENAQFDVIDLSVIRKENNKLYVAHRVLGPFITPKNFSWQYHKKFYNLVTKKYGWKQKMLYFLSRFVPKPKGSQINGVLKRFFSPFVPTVFPTRKVVVASLNRFPELLCNKNYVIYSLTESWDHCVKWPNGYASNFLFAWNQDLASDWRKYQGDVNVIPTYPWKLRYAIEEVYKKKKYKTLIGKPKCMYAVASTKLYSVEKLVDLEYRIIEELCKGTQLAGWDFFIKPRPIGDPEEFVEFKNKYPHVTVGYCAEGGDTPANYYLDDEYNEQRFEELMSCNMVINCFTTFGLDAALAGIPVMQLDLQESTEFMDSTFFYENHHIKQYLINKKELLFHVKADEKLELKVVDFLNDRDEKSLSYSSYLRKWLIPDKDFKEVLDDVTNKILE